MHKFPIPVLKNDKVHPEFCYIYIYAVILESLAILVISRGLVHYLYYWYIKFVFIRNVNLFLTYITNSAHE